MLKPRTLRGALLAAVLLCGPAAADELAPDAPVAGAPAAGEPVVGEPVAGAAELTDPAATSDPAVAPPAAEPPLEVPPFGDSPGFNASSAPGIGDFVWSFVRSMLMLGVVLALVYLVLHKGVGKLVSRTQTGRRMKVVDRIVLEQRRTLFIVDVDGEEMLLAATDGGVTRLDRPPTAQAPTVDGAAGRRFTTDVPTPEHPPVTGVMRQELSRQGNGEQLATRAEGEAS